MRPWLAKWLLWAAVVFGLFVGFVIYRSLTLRDLFELLIESAETSAVILVVIGAGVVGVYAWLRGSGRITP